MEEKHFLDEWLQSGKNRELYDSIVGHLRKSGNCLLGFSDDSIDAVWSKVVSRAAGDSSQRRLYSMGVKVWCIAAAIASIFVICGGMVWYDRYTRVTPPVLSEAVTHAIEQSVGAGRAGVLLAGGSTPSTVSGQSISPRPVGNAQVVEYQFDPDDVERLLDPKMVETQRTRESWIKLDDGTMVHLGANSRIVYPERFPASSLLSSSSLREVIVDGEAYFMVAHDASRPFVVHTRCGDITDYGTEFYVSTKSGATHVALVSGKVGVRSDVSDEVLLKPSQKARIEIGGRVRVAHADLDRYVAWNTGKYAFHEIPVRKLIEIISMWYGRKVSYDASLGGHTVSGVFYKYAGIGETLESLSLALGVDGGCFTVSDNANQ